MDVKLAIRIGLKRLFATLFLPKIYGED